MRLTWIYGPPAVGKSVTAWHLFTRLADDGAAVAYVDIDQLGMSFPETPDDPDRHRLKARALVALAAVRVADGVDHLVVSGVIEPELRAWYDGLLAGHDVRWCRLRAPDDELEARLAARGAWGADPAEVRAEAAALDAAGLTDPVVDAGASRTVAQVAADVVAATSTPVGSAPVTPPAVTAVPVTASDVRAVDPAAGTSSQDLPAPSADDPPGEAIWLTGAAGIGKSAIGWGVFMGTLQHGPTAFVDAQQLGFVAGLDDDTLRDAPSTGTAAVWTVLRAAGAESLVVVGAREPGERLPADVLAPTPVRVVHLEASPADLRARIAARGRGEGVRLAGDDLVGRDADHLDAVAERAQRQQARLAARPEVDVRVDTTGRIPAEAAAEVLAAVRRPVAT